MIGRVPILGVAAIMSAKLASSDYHGRFAMPIKKPCVHCWIISALRDDRGASANLTPEMGQRQMPAPFSRGQDTMGRQLYKLTTRTVAGLKEPGRYSDGGGLYLSISLNGGRRWVFIYTRQGKTREMGLGSAADGNVGLAEARRKAQDARDTLAATRDPIETKRDAERAAAVTGAPTFGQFADEYIASMGSAWRNKNTKDSGATRLPNWRPR